MKTIILQSHEILAGYDAVAQLYPYTPSLSHWRAWEYASYKYHHIDGRILDIGCGDGQYFRLIWPHAREVVGIDLDAGVAERARGSGVYHTVHVGPAHQIPECDAVFDNAFANCSLEHMDHIEGVLRDIFRCLKKGGTLSCSVVSNRFEEWSLLPFLIKEAGFDEVGRILQEKFLAYHHLANPFPVDRWVATFEAAGFEVDLHIPILPRNNSGAFLLMDSLWHVQRGSGGELGDVIHPYLASNPRFPAAFRKIIEGLLEMETDWHNCSGAVFRARKA
ncbi:hypothetical protein DNX69_25240 [Rhodopseudomonas palustris]|uniref:Methyltransferase type 11 domain-containing protein n=1 Tax=Rhodopseudomonas palustris TaxID=1076 RepID=A0A323UAZ0_RHOPL|nr:class I SAM-dependent methyltransferase [Rhodopseudomonas palustris]PZA09403.1 hypothetical protein DNX69_25240 [Rhodopseudomonas palustris]